MFTVSPQRTDVSHRAAGVSALRENRTYTIHVRPRRPDELASDAVGVDPPVAAPLWRVVLARRLRAASLEGKALGSHSDSTKRCVGAFVSVMRSAAGKEKSRRAKTWSDAHFILGSRDVRTSMSGVGFFGVGFRGRRYREAGDVGAAIGYADLPPAATCSSASWRPSYEFA